ncbi:MAG: presqualene diphosphate synthase HpnD [Alphaproteobacteria bacterium]
MTTAQTSVSVQDDAQREVTGRVVRAKTSFAAGMAALPAPRRDAMHALYAFCREVDDIADDGPTEPQRRADLAAWRHRINALFTRGVADEAISRALLPAIAAFKLQAQDFLDIIDGMEMDAGTPIVAPDLATLDLYCDRVASAVGRASVRIFGDAGHEAMRVAYHLGRALQLTNILRDLHEDSLRGRFYLPRETLLRHGLPLSLAALTHPNLPLACRDIAAMAATHFTQSRQAMRTADRAAMTPARLMGGYYAAILQRLIAADWRDMKKRVSLPIWQKLLVLLRYRFFA